MINEKICHLTLSWTYPGLPCIIDRCVAWVPECPRLNAADRECVSDDCIAMDRDYMECKGGCRLI